MANLKLSKLPDRTPVKITITVSPELNRALLQYAEIYRVTYGQTESVAELIPFMLGAFVDGDRGFAKASKEDGAGAAPLEPPRRRRGRPPAAHTTSLKSTAADATPTKSPEE